MNGRQFIYHMQGLTKTFPAGKKVLDNVHLSFYPDAKIGVLGVNGSGKSTLLRIIDVYKRQIMYHPYLMLRYRLDGVVTLIDAINGEATLDAHEERCV